MPPQDWLSQKFEELDMYIWGEKNEIILMGMLVDETYQAIAKSPLPSAEGSTLEAQWVVVRPDHTGFSESQSRAQVSELLPETASTMQRATRHV